MFNIPQWSHQPGSAFRQGACHLVMDVWAAGQPSQASEEGASGGLISLLVLG